MSECRCDSFQTSCPSCGEQHIFVIDREAKPYSGFNPNPEKTPRMTPEERAERLHHRICSCSSKDCLKVAEVAAQIQQAETEGFKRGVESAHGPVISSGPAKLDEMVERYKEEKYAQGFAEGIERAASMADDSTEEANWDLAKAIRSLRVGGKAGE